MKKIIICVGLILGSAAVSTVDAAIPVRKNLVETVDANAKLNTEETFSVETSNVVKEDAAAPSTPMMGGSKSHVTAILLAFFLGGLGIHRFYLGYTWQGVVQLLTLGGLGIWSFIDFIRIIIEDLQPKDGRYS